MTGPNKPIDGAVRPLAAVILAQPDMGLNRDEIAILSSFRAMDGRSKTEALVRMDRIARTHPGRARPIVRLVASNPAA